MLVVSLTVSALLFVAWSWHWPLVGDASLIHYIAFLIERGWAPYRDLGDMNMPGSFLIELAAMHVFGYGDLAWRIFDFTLLGCAAAAFFVITRRAEMDRGSARLAGLFAACLFALVHGRDGFAQGGQRDLTMAVCLVAATAFLFVAVRRCGPRSATRKTAGISWAAAGFGLLSGVALTIKPTAVALSLTQLALAGWTVRRFLRAYAGGDGESATKSVLLRYVAPAALAGLVAPAIALGFLLREGAVGAFLDGFHGIVPYYASLGHRPLGYILLHSLSPLLAVVIVWLAMLAVEASGRRSGAGLGGQGNDEASAAYVPPMAMGPPWMGHPGFWRGFESALKEGPRDWERAALVFGVVFGVLNCVVQARALPYYRYPLLVFLLPLMALDFVRGLDAAEQSWWRARLQGKAVSVLAIAGLAVGGLFLAPQSAVLIHRYRWGQTDFLTSLQGDLERLGGAQLSGRVQCIDSVSGCGTVLYRMRLEPATGVLSDFLLFGPGDVGIVRETRAEFSAAIGARPPQVIVVTSHLHIDGPDDFLKLERWSAFEAFLAANYKLEKQWTPTRKERWWSREEFPASYRVYVLRAGLK